MIVSDCFEGDDVVLARAQHDVYGDALGIIVRGCRQHFVQACQIVGTEHPHDRWPPDLSLDHRTLQATHDLLAAAWRYRARPPQPSLIDDTPVPPDMADWRQWLGAEVRRWDEHPDLVRLVVTIVTNQNGEPGYAAEDELTTFLRARFDDVPWKGRAGGLD